LEENVKDEMGIFIEEEEKESLDDNNVSEELKKCKEELDDTTDRLKRMMAEFDNYKKRSSKERENLYGSIVGDIVEKMLPVLDNLEKACEAQTEDASYKAGVEMVLKQYLDVLTSFGVKKIETVGQTFDPEVHEAVSSVQDDNFGEKEIVQEFRTGYMVGTKVIRHAMVVVAN